MPTLVLPDMTIPGRYVTREGPTVPATLHRGVVTWRDGNGRERTGSKARFTPAQYPAPTTTRTR